MATVNSAQIVATRSEPFNRLGKLRIAYFYYKNETGGTLEADTVIALQKLPKGRIRVLPALSRFRTTAWGAGVTLDLGHDAYRKAPTNSAAPVQAADADAFVDGLDVATATADQKLGTGIKFDLYSLDEVMLTATVKGAVLPANAEIEGYVVYVQD